MEPPQRIHGDDGVVDPRGHRGATADALADSSRKARLLRLLRGRRRGVRLLNKRERQQVARAEAARVGLRSTPPLMG